MPAVREIEHLWIEMPDGVRLAARAWLPADSESRPVPGILEYLPYRKRDQTRLRDERLHGWLAQRGFACLRVDVRGTGDSQGVLEDEYSEPEIADGLAVLDWMARQPWCSGRLGLIGKSWGGINALALAARRPAALGAVVAVCASDDRWATDAHWMGGCLLLENLVWGAVLFTQCALPPDPELVGSGWRAMWQGRLAAVQPLAARWMAHARRDAYWERASVRDDYAAIACPVLLVSGWADAYRSAVPRLLSGLRVPRHGLVGPWAHHYPHEGQPGPAIGFLQEVVAWFDRWLRGAESDDVQGRPPCYRVWMPEGASGEGRWVAETAWPSPRLVARQWVLGGDGRLSETGAAAERVLRVASPQSVGECAGSWCAFDAQATLPGDQRADDARSLCFDSEPLAERLEILGAPAVHLVLRADSRQAFVAARLNDVAPDGRSTRVTYALLDLAHAHGSSDPRGLLPDSWHEVTLVLEDCAWSFRPGHRLRLALSTALWPIAWPAPRPVTLAVRSGASHLRLPVRPPRSEDASLPGFEPPLAAPAGPYVDVHPGGLVRRHQRDGPHAAYEIRADLEVNGGPSLTRFPHLGLDFGSSMRERFAIRDDDPLSAQAAIEQETLLRREGWQVRVTTRHELRATAEHFLLTAELRALEGGEIVVERRFEERVPRPAW